jgi:hypothetical protein
MTSASGGRRVLAGVMAGLFGGVAVLVIVYIGSVVAIFFPDQEILGTLLAAVTYLPIMLIILLFPTLALGILLGVLLSIINHQRGRLFSFSVAALVGLLVAEVVFSFILPLIISPEPGDFVSIASNRILTGTYGMTLGILTNGFLRWFSRSS